MPIRVITFNFGGIIASLTATDPRSWESISGPDSRSGIDYWYRQRRTGREAYINVDQDIMTVAVDGETMWSGDPNDDSELRRFVQVS